MAFTLTNIQNTWRSLEQQYHVQYEPNWDDISAAAELAQQKQLDFPKFTSALSLAVKALTDHPPQQDIIGGYQLAVRNEMITVEYMIRSLLVFSG